MTSSGHSQPGPPAAESVGQNSIGCCTGEQRPRSLVGNQAGIEKLEIRMLTDTNGIDPEFYLDNSDQPGQVSP